ncbi:MAG: dinitrogenase iron-molybdenum cofactor N-terminal domain-containing protein [Pseudomonadota bacterium]
MSAPLDPLRPLHREVALRIGLAVKELESVSYEKLIELLIQIMGEPITASKLNKLRAKKLRELGKDVFNETEQSRFETAFALLKGRGIKHLLHPKPNNDLDDFCDGVGMILIGCSSNSGEIIDADFAQCQRYLIYQVSAQAVRLIDIREPRKNLSRSEKLQSRAALLKDCVMLYSTSIGARAAAKIVSMGIHPVALEYPEEANLALAKVQDVLAKNSLPPWLAKAIGKPEQGVTKGCMYLKEESI